MQHRIATDERKRPVGLPTGAFTLIELPVVIAIVAILAAMRLAREFIAVV